jgi:hypothetical protein
MWREVLTAVDLKMVVKAPLAAWGIYIMGSAIRAAFDRSYRPPKAVCMFCLFIRNLFPFLTSVTAKPKRKRGITIHLKFLIDLFLPEERAEETLLGLEDVYIERWRPRYGRRLAMFICSWHVVGTIVAFHWGKLTKLKTFFGWLS